jgi:hypothetical protein
MPDNEDTLEMLDYGIDMLTGELPLSETGIRLDA